MRSVALALMLALLPAAANAAESGCDKFSWPLDQERQFLLDAAQPSLPSGGTLPGLARAVTVRLAPMAQGVLPTAPERAPKLAASFAGYLKLAAPAGGSPILVTLSADAWVDVVHDGRYLKPLAFTGALDCPGVRKSMKYVVPAEATLQFSNVAAPEISVVITAPR